MISSNILPNILLKKIYIAFERKIAQKKKMNITFVGPSRDMETAEGRNMTPLGPRLDLGCPSTFHNRAVTAIPIFQRKHNRA
jgi:hypothetical protein